MTRKLLTIIIPVRSEEETIGGTIELVEKTVHTPHIIMIADDTIDPSDRTIEIVEAMKQPTPVSISIKKKYDRDGFGPALARAIQKATTPYSVFVMADLCDDLHAIDRMVSEATENHLDMVVGCRYMRGGRKIGGPVLQGILSTLVNAFLFRVAGVSTRDATNAFKLYRTAFLQRILPVKPESGVEFSLQLTICAVSRNARMTDIPTTWRGRKKGHSKVRLFSLGPEYMKLIFHVLMNRFA
ncbi:MAG: Glycosyl transferase, family 2 [Candidatus Gottesmanbacteria bacterium GW2011_GWB1_44_11c]|uniref:Glycosyl transferase, family 2 n=2 Tax=Candidatus Gottesmaniibacteriota TaxID=1752720 RepID=A0A0G1IJS6_9BACT|nr:MAG: Glycosyl transferase, family 2 [Candidatus Gottesmanbacteria bacterium GW2011_GWB1_44_11c]KKT59093.1 MAG: Glycosyl transferase, family 2 [Candidatus Gottesmanbacteria bacterium GW2011_GWA1_44_24b]HCM82107.1 hypothetical protein [Patescibacteria group bacterium]